MVCPRSFPYLATNEIAQWISSLRLR
jgi:hypothetical protein